MYNSIILVISEIALSLYPQLIKLSNTTITSQISIRFITYSILALFGFIINYSSMQIFNHSLWSYISMGLVNILHVIASYSAFHILSSGVGYSLFYTYPIFNLLGRSIFFKETIKPIHFIYIAIAILGVYFITNREYKSKDLPESTNSESTNSESTNSLILIGIFAGLLSAITESLIYLVVRNEHSKTTAFQEILRFYLLGAIIGGGIIVYTIMTSKKSTSNITHEISSNSYINSSSNLQNIHNIHNKDHISLLDDKQGSFFDILNSANQLSWDQIISLVLFNALIGFLGYIFRFYTIPRLGTMQFNSLIFLGVIFSYIWGFFLSNEKIYLDYIIGSLLIILSIYMMNNQ